MANEFKVGDVVMLKGGGPPMTVGELPEVDGELSVMADWFDGNMLCVSDFPAEALVLWDGPIFIPIMGDDGANPTVMEITGTVGLTKEN